MNVDTSSPNTLNKLPAALCAAQAAVRGVAKDGRNNYHKYDYASAESIIRAAREALSAHGLALIRASVVFRGYPPENIPTYKVDSTIPIGELEAVYRLVHASGEILLIDATHPVLPGGGRPMDKAFAAADTMALRGVLRGLLLLDVVEPGEDRDRDDAPPAPPAAQGQNQSPAQPVRRTPVDDCAIIVALATTEELDKIRGQATADGLLDSEQANIEQALSQREIHAGQTIVMSELAESIGQDATEAISAWFLAADTTKRKITRGEAADTIAKLRARLASCCTSGTGAEGEGNGPAKAAKAEPPRTDSHGYGLSEAALSGLPD